MERKEQDFPWKKEAILLLGIQRSSPQSWHVVQDVKAPAERAIDSRMCGKLHTWYNLLAGHNADVCDCKSSHRF